MNYTELTERVSAEIGVTKAAAKAAVDSVLGHISTGLQCDGQVTLKGFGTFNIRTLPARLGRNPATGAALDIPERQNVGFKAHKVLKEAVAS